MDDKWMAVTCPSCEERVEAEVLAERVYWPTMTPVESAWPLIARFRLVWHEDEECEMLMLVKENLVQMPRGEQPAEADWGQAAVLYWYQGDDGEGYPALEQSPLRGLLDSANHVLPRVANYLQKAKKYLGKGEYDSCLMECRKTLEQMCRECGVQDQGLGRALRELNEGGIIDRRMLDWAIKTKELVGKVVHATGREVDKETATIVFELVEVMVLYVFVLPKKYGRLLKCLGAKEDDDGSEWGSPDISPDAVGE